MANPNYLSLTSMVGGILYSGQIPDTTATTVYAVPTGKTAKIATCTLCNTSAGTVTVSLALLKSGDVVDGTHAVLSNYSLAAGATLSVKDSLGGALLAEGEALAVTASVGAAIDVVITGAVSN